MADDLASYAQGAAAKYGVPADVVQDVMGRESGGRHYGADGQVLTSPKGALGVMQLMPSTASDLGVDPRDPYQNIDGGVRYLKQQFDTFGDWKLAKAAYNAGPGAVKKFGGVPPYAETQAYVGEQTPSAADLLGNGSRPAPTAPADPDQLPGAQDLLGGHSSRVFVHAKDAQGNPTGQLSPVSASDEAAMAQTIARTGGNPNDPAAWQNAASGAPAIQTAMGQDGQRYPITKTAMVPHMSDADHVARGDYQDPERPGSWVRPLTPSDVVTAPADAPQIPRDAPRLPTVISTTGGDYPEGFAHVPVRTVVASPSEADAYRKTLSAFAGKGAPPSELVGGLSGAYGGLLSETQGLGGGLAEVAKGGDFGGGYAGAKAAFNNTLQAERDRHPLAMGASEFAGGLATPVGGPTADFISGGKTALSVGARSGLVGAGYGAIAGASAAPPGQEGQGALNGGLIGGVTGAAAPWVAQKAIQAGTAVAAPVVNAISRATGGRVPQIAPPTYVPQNDTQALIGQGVPLTPGQVMGGPARAVESALGKVPGFNLAVAPAQARAVHGWNLAVGNRVLEPLGLQLPGNMKAGQPMVQHLDSTIGKAYDDALAKVPGVTLDPEFHQALTDVRDNSETMFGDDAGRLNAIIDKDILRRFSPATGSLDGDTWKSVDSKLGQMASTNRQTKPEFADAVTGLQGQWRDLLERSNPAAAAEIDKANQAWAMFKRAQKAAVLSSGSETEPGIFTPGQLLTASRTMDKSTDKGATARGSALLQDMARQGQNVLGKSAPNAPNLMQAAGLLALGATGGHAIHASVPMIAGATALAGAYSPPLKAAVRAIAGRGLNAAAVPQMQSAARTYVPLAAAAGAVAGRGVPQPVPSNKPTGPIIIQ